MKRLIIGCGYLGLRAARTWLARGDEVWALTRSPLRADELRHLGIHPLVGDVLIPESLSSLNLGERLFDTVLYAVARGRGADVSMRELYVEGLRHALSQFQPLPSRLVYISSTSVYGQQDGEWIDETSPCEPTHENGRISWEAERLFQSQLRERGGDGVILRLAGIYGPGRLIARAAALQSHEPIQGDPDDWLNLIHVDDAVRAVMAAADRGAGDDIYLVADDEPVVRRRFYQMLANLLHAPEPRFENRASDGEERLPSRGATNKRCSNRKLRDVLKVDLAFPTVATGLPDALSRS